MSHMIEDMKSSLDDVQNRNELRAFVQEEIFRAFDVALNAAADPPVGLHQLNDAEFRARREIQKEIVKEISRAVRSALNHLKADAQARAIETTEPERAARIRALADPSF